MTVWQQHTWTSLRRRTGIQWLCASLARVGKKRQHQFLSRWKRHTSIWTLVKQLREEYIKLIPDVQKEIEASGLPARVTFLEEFVQTLRTELDTLTETVKEHSTALAINAEWVEKTRVIILDLTQRLDEVDAKVADVLVSCGKRMDEVEARLAVCEKSVDDLSEAQKALALAKDVQSIMRDVLLIWNSIKQLDAAKADKKDMDSFALETSKRDRQSLRRIEDLQSSVTVQLREETLRIQEKYAQLDVKVDESSKQFLHWEQMWERLAAYVEELVKQVGDMQWGRTNCGGCRPPSGRSRLRPASATFPRDGSESENGLVYVNSETRIRATDVAASESFACPSLPSSTPQVHPAPEDVHGPHQASLKALALKGTALCQKEPIMAMEVNRIFCAEQINVPPELPDILKDFTKAVIREDPSAGASAKMKLYQWSRDYFKKKLGEVGAFNVRQEGPEGSKQAANCQYRLSFWAHVGRTRAKDVDDSTAAKLPCCQNVAFSLEGVWSWEMAQKPFHAFQDLVHEIEQEYEEELARLRLENTWMRQRLGFAKDEHLNQEKVLGRMALSAAREAPSPPSPTSSRLADPDSGEPFERRVSVDSLGNRMPAPIVVNGGVVEAKEFTFETNPMWHTTDVKLSAWETSISAELTQDLQKVGLPMASGELGSNVKNTTHRLMKRCQLPMSPNAPIRLSWDVASMILISYDVWWIPLQCFDPAEDTFTTLMGWVSLIFWTLDMVATLLVGYFDDGELVLSPKRIACRYLRTWFLPDLIVVLPDWFTRLVDPEGGDGLATVARMIKGFRAIRILRLLRLLKLQRLMNMVYDLIDSEYMFIVFTMIRLIVAITVLNHVIACIWYLVGYLTMEAGMPNWLEDTGLRNVYTSEFAWKYLTSLHWSLTQFTPASMDVSARNEYERIMSILVLFFSLVAFSSIVGSVTNSMTALRNMSGDSKKQFWLLRRFLNHKKIGKTTSARIIRFLEHQTANQQGDVNPGSITILTLLSEPLKNLLAYELSKKHVENHPFFCHLEHEMSPILVKLCDTVLRTIDLASEDVVFHPGEEGEKMYFVKSGHLEYMLPNGEVLRPRLLQKAWLAEAVLWTTWWHRGEFKASTPSELAIIKPGPFNEVMKMHPRPWSLCRRYAEVFVKFLNQTDHKILTDVISQADYFERQLKSCDRDFQDLEVEASALPTSDGDGGTLGDLPVPDERGALQNRQVSEIFPRALSRGQG
ncbi:Hcn4 [Symbiodinium sp. CCMP2592]|nr:Hcn4 [Symbiodinium sp. CCMP2592]